MVELVTLCHPQSIDEVQSPSSNFLGLSLSTIVRFYLILALNGKKLHFMANFWFCIKIREAFKKKKIREIFQCYKCLTFQGGKQHFFFKCPNNGLVPVKKISRFDLTMPPLQWKKNNVFFSETRPLFWHFLKRSVFFPLEMSKTCKNFLNPKIAGKLLSIGTQNLFYQNDSEWPKMDFKHNFENR